MLYDFDVIISPVQLLNVADTYGKGFGLDASFHIIDILDGPLALS